MWNKAKEFFKNFSQEYFINDLIESPLSPQLIAYHDPGCFVSQQYNQIAGALLHNKELKNIRSLLVTSPQPADGKSTTISNLAICLASNYNQKVLLVDADWRRPQLGRFFSHTELKPLPEDSSVNAELRDYIFDTPIPDLSILPVVQKENWIEFIMEILPDLESDFDLVLIDTAPVMKVVDATILGRVVSAIILVVRGQDTPIYMINEAEQILASNSCPSKACILVNNPNSVDVYNYLVNPHYRRYYTNYYGEYGHDRAKPATPPKRTPRESADLSD